MNKRLIVKKELLIAFLPIFIVLSVSASYITDSGAWRSIISYASFSSFCLASYLFFKNRSIEEFVYVLKLVAWTWLTFGLLQILTGIDAAGPFKTHIFDVSENRGVSAMATEPSYYGLICFFIFVFLEVIQVKKPELRFFKLKALLILQIILLAQSSLSLVYFALYLGIKFMTKAEYFKYLIIGMMAITLIAFYLSDEKIARGKAPRIVELTQLIIKNPTRLAMIDGSINHRLNHIAIAMTASIDNYLMPISIVEWPGIYKKYLKVYSSWIIWAPSADRIMSGYGSLFFELGWFAIIIIIFITRAIKLSLRGTGTSIRFMLFLNLLMFSAIPMAFPPLGCLIGFLSATSVKRQQTDDSIEPSAVS